MLAYQKSRRRRTVLGPQPAVACASSNTQTVARKATRGTRAGRMGAAEQRSFWAGARTRALRHLTCPILFERNERSE
jgi:hypothetical protein